MSVYISLLALGAWYLLAGWALGAHFHDRFMRIDPDYAEHCSRDPKALLGATRLISCVIWPYVAVLCAVYDFLDRRQE